MAEVFLPGAGPALVLPEGPAKDFDPGLALGRDMGIDLDSNSDFSDFFANDPSSGLLFGLAVDFNLSLPLLDIGSDAGRRENTPEPDAACTYALNECALWH